MARTIKTSDDASKREARKAARARRLARQTTRPR